jgi:hypothetical protein
VDVGEYTGIHGNVRNIYKIGNKRGNDVGNVRESSISYQPNPNSLLHRE